MMKVLCLFCTMVFIGCSSILSSLDGGGIELVDGDFYYDPLEATSRYSTRPSGASANVTRAAWYNHGVAHSYRFSLDVPRFIRHVYIETLGAPVKNLDIYAQLNDADNWKMVNQIKSPVDNSTRIEINVRASEIRMIQKTVSLRRDADDIIIGFKVYAQKEFLQ